MANIIVGSLGRDLLAGTALKDLIFGDTEEFLANGDRGGNDRLYGRGANDTLYGETITMSEGAIGGYDKLYGEHGNDKVYGDAETLLDGRGGRDKLYGGIGNDSLWGDADVLGAAQGSKAVGGNDWLHGNQGKDVLYGDAREMDRSIRGGQDYLKGDNGNDLLYGDAEKIGTLSTGGDDTLRGGDGRDKLYGDAARIGDYQAGIGRGNQGGDDSLYGGRGKDVLYGDAETLTLPEDIGINEVVATLGDDKLQGGDGNDTLYGDVANVEDFSTTSLSLEAIADATVRADLDARANDNYGLQESLLVGTGRSPDGTPDALRSLLQFDLSSITQPVSHAALELTLVGFGAGASTSVYTVDVHRILDSGSNTPWVEGNGYEGVVGNGPPGSTGVDDAFGVAWSAIDANNQDQPLADPTVAATATISQTTPIGTTVQWDITDLVNNWITGGSANFGMMLTDITTDGLFRSIYFASREGDSFDFPDFTEVTGPRLVLNPAPIVWGDDTLYGGEGNDTLYGGGGQDILIGIDPKSTTPGKDEIDSLTGDDGGDRFVLGDASHIYYDDGSASTSGLGDYALITDYSASEGDTIQLFGTINDYQLGASPFGASNDTAIFLKGNPNELIAVVQGVAAGDLNLEFVS